MKPPPISKLPSLGSAATHMVSSRGMNLCILHHIKICHRIGLSKTRGVPLKPDGLSWFPHVSSWPISLYAHGYPPDWPRFFPRPRHAFSSCSSLSRTEDKLRKPFSLSKSWKRSSLGVQTRDAWKGIFDVSKTGKFNQNNNELWPTKNLGMGIFWHSHAKVWNSATFEHPNSFACSS